MVVKTYKYHRHGRTRHDREKNSISWGFFFLLLMVAIFLIRIWQVNKVGYISWVIGFAAFLGAFSLYRFILGYIASIKDIPPTHVEEQLGPTYAICVPCYNEGEQMLKTLMHLDFDYPKDRYEVVVIDDGSTDDTKDWVIWGVRYLRNKGINVKALYPGQNQGKRKATTRAILETTADIIVLIDSDSIVEPNALKRFTDYFRYPKTAGVSVHIDVLNKDESLLSKSQVARYYVMFRFFKAAESLYGSVTILTGCCAAYRREPLMAVLDEWTNQTFLGKPRVYSDDRALTNFLLRDGYDTKYAPDIQAWTIVPATLKKFIKQQMRWRKGALINAYMPLPWMWKRPFPAAVLWYGTVFLGPLSMLFVIATLWAGLFVYGYTHLVLLVALITFSTLMYGALYSIFRKDHYWFYGIVFTVLYLTVLVWQLPLALITIKDNKWGTR
jgi:hyaluronan synthase